MEEVHIAPLVNQLLSWQLLLSFGTIRATLEILILETTRPVSASCAQETILLPIFFLHCVGSAYQEAVSVKSSNLSRH